MSTGDALHDLVSSSHLWRGAATAVVAADAAALARTSADRARLLARRSSEWGAPVLSAIATFAAYSCVPDTERALWLLGATAGAAGAALLLRLRWEVVALGVTVGLMWVALEDGPPRTSALIGTLAIAVLHVVLQHRVHLAVDTSPVLSLLAVATVAMVVASRVAGRGDGWGRPVLEATAALVLAVLAARRIQPAPVPP